MKSRPLHLLIGAVAAAGLTFSGSVRAQLSDEYDAQNNKEAAREKKCFELFENFQFHQWKYGGLMDLDMDFKFSIVNGKLISFGGKPYEVATATSTQARIIQEVNEVVTMNGSLFLKEKAMHA